MPSGIASTKRFFHVGLRPFLMYDYVLREFSYSPAKADWALCASTIQIVRPVRIQCASLFRANAVVLDANPDRADSGCSVSPEWVKSRALSPTLSAPQLSSTGVH